MNSSVLNDPRYETEIENVVEGLKEVTLNPLDWWDLFIMIVQGTSISYCKQKSQMRSSLKNFLTKKVVALENLDHEAISLEQRKSYIYFNNQLKKILEHEIRGHEIRTRGQPNMRLMNQISACIRDLRRGTSQKISSIN